MKSDKDTEEEGNSKTMRVDLEITAGTKKTLGHNSLIIAMVYSSSCVTTP